MGINMRDFFLFLVILLSSGMSCSVPTECTISTLLDEDSYNRTNVFNDIDNEICFENFDTDLLNLVFGGNNIVSDSLQVVLSKCNQPECVESYFAMVLEQFNITNNGFSMQMATECGNQFVFAIENAFLVQPEKTIELLDQTDFQQLRKFYFDIGNKKNACFGRIECISLYSEIIFISKIGQNTLSMQKDRAIETPKYIKHFLEKLFCIQREYLDLKFYEQKIDNACYKQAVNDLKRRKSYLVALIDKGIMDLPTDFFSAKVILLGY